MKLRAQFDTPSPSPRIMPMTASIPSNVSDTLALLSGAGYVADRSLATAVTLSLRLDRPLFLEGEAGVGKTEIAKVLAACSATRGSTSRRRSTSGTTRAR